MNILIVLVSLLPLGLVWLSGELSRAQRSHILRSGAYPNRANSLNSTHFFEILAQQPIAALLIQAPSGLSVERIQIANQRFRLISHTVTLKDSSYLIDLNLPALPHSILTVSMQRVRSQNRAERSWSYEVYAKYLNDSQFSQLGITRVFVYSDHKSH